MNIETNKQYLRPNISADSAEFQSTKKAVLANLRLQLDKLSISGSDYVIDGEGPSGQLCIWFDTSAWVVFVSERGERFNCTFFSDVWQAANYFLWELVRTHRQAVPNFPAVAIEL